MTAATGVPEHIAAYKRNWGDNDFMRAQGLEVEEIAAGEVVVRLPHARSTQRGAGHTPQAINGGVIAYMFDGALGFSVTSALLALPEASRIDPRELVAATVNLDITYLAAALGDRFEAYGKVVRTSRSTAFAEGELLDARGKVCATAKGIWRVFWPRQTGTVKR